MLLNVCVCVCAERSAHSTALQRKSMQVPVWIIITVIFVCTTENETKNNYETLLTGNYSGLRSVPKWPWRGEPLSPLSRLARSRRWKGWAISREFGARLLLVNWILLRASTQNSIPSLLITAAQPTTLLYCQRTHKRSILGWVSAKVFLGMKNAIFTHINRIKRGSISNRKRPSRTSAAIILINPFSDPKSNDLFHCDSDYPRLRLPSHNSASLYY